MICHTAERPSSVLQTGLSSLLAGFDTLLVDPAVKEIRKDGVAAAYSKLEGAGARIVGREKGEDWEASVRSWMGLPT